MLAVIIWGPFIGILPNCSVHVVVFTQSWKATTHPIGMLIDYLTKCFVETYNGLGTHKYLLPYATAELNSLVFRLHETIR